MTLLLFAERAFLGPVFVFKMGNRNSSERQEPAERISELEKQLKEKDDIIKKQEKKIIELEEIVDSSKTSSIKNHVESTFWSWKPPGKIDFIDQRVYNVHSVRVQVTSQFAKVFETDTEVASY